MLPVRELTAIYEKKNPLPSVSTLRRWCGKIPTKPGVLKPVIEIMAESKMSEIEKLCVISSDEMKIQAQFQYDRKNDEVLVPGKYVQVVMARRIIGNWKQPIFYEFDCKMSQDVLFNVISQIESAGFHVVAMVSDLGPTNRGLLTELGITPQTPYFINPIHSTEKVYVFADVPHLIK